MNAMTEFQFHTRTVRVFPTEDGQSFWVVAKDVAEAIGYRDAGNLVRQVPQKHRSTRSVSTSLGVRDMLLIDESGLYRAVLRSDKTDAEPFIDWVTADVLPSIRKTGAYVAPRAAEAPAASSQLLLAQELGQLRDQIGVLTGEVLAVYRLLGRAQSGELRAAARLAAAQQRQAKRDAVDTILRLEAAGRPRGEIARSTGKTLNHVRQVIFQARRDGLLPAPDEAQKELPLAG